MPLPHRSRTAATVAAAAAVAAGTLAAAGPALAHHAMDRATPATLAQGLLSGLGHPVIGPDHLAAVAASGLIAAAAGAAAPGRRAAALPLAFVGASLAGVGLHLASLSVPFAEGLVALSVLALGAVLLLRRMPGAGALAALFAAAGALHGHAYGEAIVGAEPTPLLAYLAGLALVQAAVATGCLALARGLAGGLGGRAYRVAALAVLAVGTGSLALAAAA